MIDVLTIKNLRKYSRNALILDYEEILSPDFDFARIFEFCGVAPVTVSETFLVKQLPEDLAEVFEDYQGVVREAIEVSEMDFNNY